MAKKQSTESGRKTVGIVSPKGPGQPHAAGTGGGALCRGDRGPDQGGSPRSATRLEHVSASRIDLYLRRQVRFAGDHAQVHRQPAAGRNRDLDARHRSRLALARRTRDGQVVALGASHRRDQWRLDQGRARNGRNHRGADSLYLELCDADRPRAKSCGADQEPHLPRHGVGQPGPIRGSDPLRIGSAGRTDLTRSPRNAFRSRSWKPRCRRPRGSR